MLICQAPSENTATLRVTKELVAGATYSALLEMEGDSAMTVVSRYGAAVTVNIKHYIIAHYDMIYYMFYDIADVSDRIPLLFMDFVVSLKY